MQASGPEKSKILPSINQPDESNKNIGIGPLAPMILHFLTAQFCWIELIVVKVNPIIECHPLQKKYR